MKVSVSIPDDDVAFVDEFAREQGIESRSAVLQRAIQLLRQSLLEQQYEQAYAEWRASGEDVVWDGMSGHGIDVDTQWW
jgi:metal-responsive CopG/Arc/MetJ family transcriptional regulator